MDKELAAEIKDAYDKNRHVEFVAEDSKEIEKAIKHGYLHGDAFMETGMFPPTVLSKPQSYPFTNRGEELLRSYGL